MEFVKELELLEQNHKAGHGKGVKKTQEGLS